MAPSNPGDRTGFPIADGCVVTLDQVGNVCGDDVSIGGDNSSCGHRLGCRTRQPGQVEIDCVVADGVIVVTHLFDDVVDDGFGSQDHLAVFNLPLKPAAGADIDDPFWAPAENGILGRSGCGDLAPAAMQEYDRVPVDLFSEKIAIGRGFNPCQWKVGRESPPFLTG